MAHVCLCTSACRSYDVEENKGIIPDEVDDVGASPQRFSVFSSTTIQRTPRARIDARPRRRTAFSDRLVASSPIFYGWVIAALVALVALLVSPAQVYCVGAVVDPMLLSLELTRLQLSGAYAVASLLSAPLITVHPLLLKWLTRRTQVLQQKTFPVSSGHPPFSISSPHTPKSLGLPLRSLRFTISSNLRRKKRSALIIECRPMCRCRQ